VPHKIRHLGISNTSLEILAALAAAATVPPAVVQNRFYAETGYDVPLRQFCNVRGIVYQSFWTLTGNPALLRGGAVDKLSREAGVSVEVAMYALCVELGIAPLNGTTDATRMAGDIEGVGRVRNWSFVYASKWSEIVTAFREAIGQDERAEIEK
jgi:diketogulonate reductase-like aldo/keto reductase